MIKKYFLFLTIVVSACQAPKKNHDFTFYKWSLDESYYLKYNSTDTLYIINAFPFEQTAYTILTIEEKENIQSSLDNISFPIEKDFSNSLLDDGLTYAFSLKNGKQSQQLKIHGDKGPKQFWLFGKSLETIKDKHSYIKTNKKFDLSIIQKTEMPPVLFK